MADQDDTKRDIEERATFYDEAFREAKSNKNVVVSDRSAGKWTSAQDGGSKRLLGFLLLFLLGAAAWFNASSPRELQPTSGIAAEPSAQSITLPMPPRDAPQLVTVVPEKSAVPDIEPADKASEAARDMSEEDKAAERDAARSGEERITGLKSAAVASQELATPTVEASALGQFTVQVGAYALQSHLVEAQNKVHRLGYPTSIHEITGNITMYRLRVGISSPGQGDAKMAQIRLLGGDPFFLMDNDLMIVYAGAFQNAGKAHQLALVLREQGIHVVEERVATEIPLNILRFGEFTIRAEAERAAARARATGLETLIVRVR